MSIEFKYERTPENTALQMSGKLRGLRTLNLSNIIPTLEGSKLTLHMKGLNPGFFSAGSNRTNHDTSREAAFEMLKTTFSQVDVWVKITDEAGAETKRIIRPSTPVARVGEEDKLIITLDVEEAVDE